MVRCMSKSIPEVVAHGLTSALSLRVHHEVPQAGATWGHSSGGSEADPRGVQDKRHQGSEGARWERPRPFAAERSTEAGAEPSDAGREGEEFASRAEGLPPEASEPSEIRMPANRTPGSTSGDGKWSQGAK